MDKSEPACILISIEWDGARLWLDPVAEQVNDRDKKSGIMEKSLVVNYQKCASCRICELVCSFTHFEEFNPGLSCVRVVSMEEKEEYFPVCCVQCSSPVCMGVCPVQAISIDPKKNIALVDSNRCIGCKLCSIHCPFGAAGFNPGKGVAFKCDLCEGDPQCVKFCPSGAIEYIPLDEAMDKRRRKLIEHAMISSGSTCSSVDN